MNRQLRSFCKIDTYVCLALELLKIGISTNEQVFNDKDAALERY